MSEQISLALSGGGSRAMAFHAGVLRYFAEEKVLEEVVEISSVSGGSLIVGLIFAKSKMHWPTSNQYINDVFPKIREVLINSNIQSSALLRILSPAYWRFLSSRPNIVARAIHMDWKIRGALEDLPSTPSWSINCTTAENGRRFRFKGGRLGDYESGYAEAGRFPLASAMAISAAFPIGIGPFRLYADRLTWWRKPKWNAPVQTKVPPPSRYLHLYDGGVYDNLGLEPLFDAGSGTPRNSHRIVVSDAGAPLWRGFGLSALNPFRIKRLMDVMMDQNRALRIRGFINYIKHSKRGAYLGIVRTEQTKKIIETNQIFGRWLSPNKADYVQSFPTSLLGLSAEDFDLIAQHGYETAKLTQIAFPYLPSSNRNVK